MARFERSRERRGKGDSKVNYLKRNNGDRRGFDNSREGRNSGRESKRFSRNGRDLKMTKVTCSSCGVECEVPFKPTSSRPVYCNDCFAKKSKGSFNKPSDKDLDIINEKLNKIMKALKIE